MVGRVQIKTFDEIDLSDGFFDSLKSDYREFPEWFSRKADKQAFVIYNDQHHLEAFLYLKNESKSEVDDYIDPELPLENRLKLATLKVAEGGQGFKYGEGLLKIAFDTARQTRARYIYVTVFPKHFLLIQLLQQLGFKKHGIKSTANGMEEVYIRLLTEKYDATSPLSSYPFVPQNPTYPVRIVPIEAEYHSLLFPASDLRGAQHLANEYIPASNAIRKAYLAKGPNAGPTAPGDLLFFYRKKHPDELGASRYKSAVTTLGVVEKRYCEGIDFRNLEEYLKIAGKRTAFSQEELKEQYRDNRRIIIQFLYVLSFGKGKNVNNQKLMDLGAIPKEGYWGFRPISNDSYRRILKEAGVDDSYLIN